MNPVIEEWIEKAEGDFTSLQRELRARNRPNHDLACFLAQQCAEKYLKARLSLAGIPFAKTHDLSSLLKDVLPVEPAWAAFTESLAILSNFAVRFRYPGASADREIAREVGKHCRAFRAAARAAMGLT